MEPPFQLVTETIDIKVLTSVAEKFLVQAPLQGRLRKRTLILLK